MWTGTPLFPDTASTMAPRVDALYFFLVGLTAFFSLLIAGLIVFYAVRFRRRAPDGVGARIDGGLVLEITWTVIPLVIAHGDLRVGRQRLLRDGAPAGRNAEHLRRRQAVDVEVPAPERRSARSTSCTCRSAGR